MWGFNAFHVGDQGDADGSGLAQASLTIVGAWMDRSVPVCSSSPMTPVPGLLGALAGQLSCSALVKAAINLAIWSPALLSQRPSQ